MTSTPPPPPDERSEAMRYPQPRSARWGLAYLERFERCEELLVRGHTPTSITSTLVSEFGITRREGDSLQATVRMRWRRNSNREGREGRLDRYRRMLEQAHQLALAETAPVYAGKDDEGKPRFEHLPKPNVRAATAVIAVLVAIEGQRAPEQPLGTAPSALPPPSGDEDALGEPTVVLAADEAEAEMMRRRDGGER